MTPRLAETFDPALPLGVVAWRSWRSMKPPVMAWLWYLNILYWVGFLYVDRPEAFWALVSYFAIGPLIVVMIARQRGLTRLSGLIHLPWLPFTLYLGLRLLAGGAGDAPPSADAAVYGIWLRLVFWSTLICVTLDVVDIVRWFAGERYVLGTPAAAARGASRASRTDAPGA